MDYKAGPRLREISLPASSLANQVHILVYLCTISYQTTSINKKSILFHQKVTFYQGHGHLGTHRPHKQDSLYLTSSIEVELNASPQCISQSERRPHALTYVETAMRLGSLINTCQTADELSKCLKQGPSKPDQGGAAKAKMESIKPELGPGLPG